MYCKSVFFSFRCQQQENSENNNKHRPCARVFYSSTFLAIAPARLLSVSEREWMDDGAVPSVFYSTAQHNARRGEKRRRVERTSPGNGPIVVPHHRNNGATTSWLVHCWCPAGQSSGSTWRRMLLLFSLPTSFSTSIWRRLLLVLFCAASSKWTIARLFPPMPDCRLGKDMIRFFSRN